MAPYRFEPFGGRHKPLRASFSCGGGDLDPYLKTRARREMDMRVAVVYVLLDEAEGRIAGYYTLSSLSVELPEGARKGLPKYPECPATLLGHLAVDERYRGQGLGKRLLLDALGRALAGSRAVASQTPRTSGRMLSTPVTDSCRYPPRTAGDECFCPWARSKDCSRSANLDLRSGARPSLWAASRCSSLPGWFMDCGLGCGA